MPALEMKLKIHHKTTIRFSDTVSLNPHHLYFYPITRNYLAVADFELTVAPVCSGIGQRVDAEDNLFHQCWFNEPVDFLEIDAVMEVITREVNPFNFIVEDATEIPYNKALDIFLEKLPLSREMTRWVNDRKELSSVNAITFLTYLCGEIHQYWDHSAPYEKKLLAPLECFDAKKGSCRDLSWMMIQMLREQNIPARLVSGYATNPSLGPGHELHAWVEAWLNGAGWIGMDPSAGLLTTEHYVPVVTSYDPANTFPVQGTHQGNAKGELSFVVSITEVEENVDAE